jgi:predicted metalloprotease
MRRLFAAAALFSVVIGLAPAVAAQDASYTSPTYGYVVSWGAEWTLEEESSEGGYDFLHLSSERSDLYLEGFIDYGGDLQTCLDEEGARLAREDGVFEVEPAGQDETIQTGDGVVVGLSRTFTFTLETDDGEEQLTQRTECRQLSSAGVVVITHYALTADYEAESDAARRVAASIVMPGQIGPGAEQGARLQELLAGAQSDLSSFWANELPELGANFRPPAYVSFSEPIETACGDTDPGADGPFYCPDDRTVYVDLVAFEQEILPYGGFVVEFTLAHEIGHHLQELLRLPICDGSPCDGGYTNLEFELMADCFSGAWARDAKARGEVADGDVDKAVIALAAYFGDPPNTPANDPEAHGPGHLRTWWFLQGYYEGAASCLTVNEDDA